jgi:trk system potassium uptake protein TrkA
MNKVCVIGLGRFGKVLAERLAADGREVLAIDSSQDEIDAIKDKVALAVRADGKDVATLRSLGVDSMDMVCVAIGDDFEAAELTLMACKELGVPKIVARAMDQVKRKILKALGAHQVIMPEEEAALRLAHNLALPSLTEANELDRNHSIVHIPVPRKMLGQTLQEMQLREKYNLNLVAIRSKPVATMMLTRQDTAEGRATADDLIRIPTGTTKFMSGDVVILVGKNVDIDRFIRDYE